MTPGLLADHLTTMPQDPFLDGEASVVGLRLLQVEGDSSAVVDA